LRCPCTSSSAGATIGIFVPILLVALRAIQIFAVQQPVFTETFGTERRRDDQFRKMQQACLKMVRADLISFKGVAEILSPVEDARSVEV
jgi:hypothetical protein